jgi:transposase
MVAPMTFDPAQLPNDVASLKAIVIAANKSVLEAEARAKLLDAEIENLKLTIAKLQHRRFGPSAERARLIDQLELQLGELVELTAQDATADEIAAQLKVNAQGQQQQCATPKTPRRKPARRPLPANLPRERRVQPGPCACERCGGNRLRKVGEDVTETLERVPAHWKVIENVTEKFTCRDCESMTQAPAPSHPIARGRAGPQLLAEVVFGKYGAHLPLNRQSEIYAHEGVELDVSTLADWVGASAATLMPLRDAIEAHVHAAERIHVDDTTVPVLAKGKCRTGRLWCHVRDDRPFGGKAAPAVVFYYSPNREGEHPQRQLANYTGIMQVDAYSGYNPLYVEGRQPGPIIEAGCWSHGRRRPYELARLRKMPVAIETVRRIDELFAIEREINGQTALQRLAVRRERSKPLVEDLERFMRTERNKLSAKNPLAKAMAYMLNRWQVFTRFLDDGRICMSNNAAERAERRVAVGRNYAQTGIMRSTQPKNRATA